MSSRRRRLSIVVPVYYNSPTLRELHAELSKAIDQIENVDAEMIFVDDGSGDDSFLVLSSLAAMDSRCKIVKLSRNHGSWIASLAGLNATSGDCVLLISADLQDPPSLLPVMYKHWLEGFATVLAVRTSREDPMMTKFFSAIFYALMRRFAIKDIPPGGGDFGLFDRKIVNILVSMQEKNSHLITQVLWTGYSRKLIPYKRQMRKAGKSRWTFSKKLKLFIDSFTAFSYFPLRLVSFGGFFIGTLGFLYALLIISRKLFYGVSVEGWSSLMVVLLIVSGALLIGMGTVGEYLWRVLDEVRKRPVFLVDQTIGFDRAMNIEEPVVDSAESLSPTPSWRGEQSFTGS